MMENSSLKKKKKKKTFKAVFNIFNSTSFLQLHFSVRYDTGNQPILVQDQGAGWADSF